MLSLAHSWRSFRVAGAGVTALALAALVLGDNQKSSFNPHANGNLKRAAARQETPAGN